MRLLVLAALALVLAGCPAPANTPPLPPDGPGPRVPVQPPEVPAPGQAMADLQTARARWADRGFGDYTMTLQRSCFCPGEWRGPFAVTVRSDRAAGTYEGAAVPEDRVLSVDALFSLLETAYLEGAALVTVTYHETLGYPTELYIDEDEMMADEEVGYRVTDLAPLGS